MSLYSILLLTIWCTSLLVSGETSHTDTAATTLRWASTGGGWRSQFACVGFANLFEQVDVLSKFSAISTTSGASWFSTQLFYSKEFYDRVVLAEDSQALYQFVVEWMDSYSAMLSDAIQAGGELTPSCNFTDTDGKDRKGLADLCSTLAYFDGDWAHFVDEMLVAAAESFGDSAFGNSKLAGNENRLDVLKETDLLILAALVPNFRIRETDTAFTSALAKQKSTPFPSQLHIL